MPTIKEIADKCGVSKQTVTSRLKELELWERHVSKSGNTYRVSDEAASIVAAALTNQEPVVVTAPEKEPAKQDDSGTAAVEIYKEYIDSLKAENARLWSQIHEKDEQLRDKDELIADLSRKLAENQQRPSFWSRLLPRGKSE